MEFNAEVKFLTQNEGEPTVNMLIKGLRIFHHVAGPITTCNIYGLSGKLVS